MVLIRNQSTEVRDGLQYSYWPKDSLKTPARMAWPPRLRLVRLHTGVDVINWNIDAPTTGCGVNRVNIQCLGHRNGVDRMQCVARHYTHSDHYGSLTEIDFASHK